MFHRTVVVRSKQKPDADFIDTVGDPLPLQIDLYAEGAQHIGASASGRHGTIAVLGNSNAGPRHDKCGSRRDIECIRSIPTGPTGIHDDGRSDTDANGP